MNKRYTYLLGILAGTISGMLVVMAIETISHSMFQLPANMDPMRKETAVYVMENAPFLAIFLIPLGWILAAGIATLAATLICREKSKNYFFIFAFLLTAASVFNLIMIPSPWWMWAMALLFIFPSALLGSRLPAKLH